MQLRHDASDGWRDGMIADLRGPNDIDRSVATDRRRTEDGLTADVAAPARRAVRSERHQLAAYVGDIDGAVRRHDRAGAGPDAAKIGDRGKRPLGWRGDDVSEPGIVRIAVRGFPAPCRAGE